MGKLLLFNTLSGKNEPIKPVLNNRLRIYSCGPTVYSHTHIGHMRTYTNTDILLRTLRYFGFDTFQVMNITDVGHLTNDDDMGEDKLEKAAKETHQDAWQLSRLYTKEFFDMFRALNINQPDVSPRATDNIAEMILLVQDLEKKGFTYRTGDGIYFDTSKFVDYGQLANVSLVGLKEGARVEKNPEKKHSTDFVLWKFSRPNEKRQMEWPSPWAEKGFPGWHIECSVMAMKYLSACFADGHFHPDLFQTIDIHSGGIEHINVHHSNEIAQSEAATGKRFVNHWVHFAWLKVDGEKMSKSLGNFYTQEDLLKRGYENLMPLRYLFLNTHYRKALNFTWEALNRANDVYWDIIKRIGEMVAGKEKKRSEEKFGKQVIGYQDNFKQALANDLNLPQALAIMHEVLKDKSLERNEKQTLLEEFDEVLGLDLINQAQDLVNQSKAISVAVKDLVNKRETARQEKNWLLADKLRSQIESAGYLVEDTPTGPRLTLVKNNVSISE